MTTSSTHPSAPLRIANFSGFYGDRHTAPHELLAGGPIDVLTGDYLAELTMFLLWRAGQHPGGVRYATSFFRQMEEVLGTCIDRGVKVVTNAGGLDPLGLADRLQELATTLGVPARVSVVDGDDLSDRLFELQSDGDPLAHLDTGRPLSSDDGAPLTANAYLGGFGIAEALAGGADIVVTGRVTDASLVVGPAAWRFGWARTDWDFLAGALAVGHVIECGTQVTGGNYAFFEEVPGLEHLGFPIAEVHPDGSAVITKHPGTGGLISLETVTAQLLYEISAPEYQNPDVVADFSTIHLDAEGENRVRLSGTKGSPPPDRVKVAVNMDGGWRNTVTFVLTGLSIPAKAERVLESLAFSLGGTEQFARFDTSLLHTDQPDAPRNEAATAELRVTVTDPDPQKVGRGFSRRATELTLSSVPGLFLPDPPGDAVRSATYWPTSVPSATLEQRVVHHDGHETRLAVAAPGDQPPGSPAPDHSPPDPPSALARHLREAVLPSGPTRRVALGTIVGARSGDKGGNANVGFWARSDKAYAWLRAFLTTDQLRALLTEAATLPIERFELPNLRALNFVIKGLLGDGVASSIRPDPQAKGLGEYLRSRMVDIPVALLDEDPLRAD